MPPEETTTTTKNEKKKKTRCWHYSTCVILICVFFSFLFVSLFGIEKSKISLLFGRIYMCDERRTDDVCRLSFLSLLRERERKTRRRRRRRRSSSNLNEREKRDDAIQKRNDLFSKTLNVSLSLVVHLKKKLTTFVFFSTSFSFGPVLLL